MVGVPSPGDGFAVLHPKQNAATNRAVAAGGAYPRVGNVIGLHHAEALIGTVGVPIGTMIKTKPGRKPCVDRHHRLTKNPPGADSGTTVTKNR
jgi:hypothetical protein